MAKLRFHRIALVSSSKTILYNMMHMYIPCCKLFISYDYAPTCITCRQLLNTSNVRFTSFLAVCVCLNHFLFSSFGHVNDFTKLNKLGYPLNKIVPVLTCYIICFNRYIVWLVDVIKYWRMIENIDVVFCTSWTKKCMSYLKDHVMWLLLE